MKDHNENFHRLLQRSRDQSLKLNKNMHTLRLLAYKMDHEPRNMQVALLWDHEDARYSLVDHSGVFLTVEKRHLVPSNSHENTGSHHTSHRLEPATGDEEIQALMQERDELQGKVETLTEEKNNLEVELHTLQEELEPSKARVREIHIRPICEQVAEFDEKVAADLTIEATNGSKERDQSSIAQYSIFNFRYSSFI